LFPQAFIPKVLLFRHKITVPLHPKCPKGQSIHYFIQLFMTSNFIDYVKICFRSGSGGAGSVHFRREKFVEKGGPDGGDGGRGGHIILRGSSQMWTLLHLKYTKHVFADNGQVGSAANCTGKQGEDKIIDVPIGTIVKDPETGEKIAEVLHDGEETHSPERQE
jgi:GTP-binding protein